MPEWLTTAGASLAGAALIGLAARDVFDSLFHPGGRGSLSRGIAAGVWVVFRRRAAAGPLALVLVLATWAALLVCGFALIYAPHVPDGFTIEAGLRDDPALLTALYFSIVTLATLGYGDATPSSDWLQLVAPLEAMVGFGLLTASVAWLLSIHPVLARRRSFAYDISLLERAERDAGVSPGEIPAEELEELHARLVEIERDLVAYPITFYFDEPSHRFSLAAALPVLADITERLHAEELPARERLHAAMLQEAIQDFVRTAGGFSGYRGLGDAEVVRRYAAQHARP